MADLAEVFASARFRLWANIYTADGMQQATDVVSVSATFALNTIPTAAILFATGVNTATRKKASIHEIRNKIRARDRITVFLKVIVASSGAQNKIAPGIYKIFSGFIAGTGYQRGINHANFVINAVHWLDDLNNSTAINGDWLPGAPADYARSALIAHVNANPNAARTSGPVPVVRFDNITDIKEDLWTKSIKPAMVSLAATPGVGTTVANNTRALDALARMPSAQCVKHYGDKLPKLGLAIPDDPDKRPQQLVDAIADYYRAVFSDSTAQNSFWAKLVGDFASDFMFAISPAVDWALPIPFCGGLRWVKDKAITISASDYSHANFTTNMSQIIEAVHVIHATGTWVNSKSERSNTPSAAPAQNSAYYQLYASYPPIEAINADDRLRGLKLFKQPPRWITGIDSAGRAALNAVLTATPPAGPIPKNATELPKYVTDTYTAYAATATIIEKLAVHWYCNEVLQQRVGELSGPLRFDIAPGSIVKIETPLVDKKQFGADDHVIASVVAVSYVINAEQARAGTAFTVAHMRTPAEEANKFYTVPESPLYTTEPFYGGPLAIPEETNG